MASKKYSLGLGTQTYGRASNDITGKSFQRFCSFVGLNEDAGISTVVFEVWLDDKYIFRRDSMDKNTAAMEIDNEVLGARSLELRTLAGLDRNIGDYGNWCDASLIRQDFA